MNVEESISTLKFADRAKHVMTQIVVNETRPVDHEMVMKLQREVKYLRQLLKQFTEKIPSLENPNVSQLLDLKSIQVCTDSNSKKLTCCVVFWS